MPASEKIVSLFEDHTDNIVKSGRGTQFGHKLNLTTGASGRVLDAVVEYGNPADAARCKPMLEHNIAFYDKAPRQAAFDGGYASKDNLALAKDLGIKDAAFHKKCGMKMEDMATSKSVFRKLRTSRAGIESEISWLKRSYGLARCTWNGL